MLTNFQFVQKIANQLIRPRPSNYSVSDICKLSVFITGQHITNIQLYKYENTRFSLNEQRVINLHLIENKNKLIMQNLSSSTCIVYLHGFSSFCTEGNFLVPNLEKQFKNMNVSICLYDMRGHGKDKGKNVTFGLQESKQLYEILVYLKKQKHYKNFILWGRSMGATTILKMLNDHKNKIETQNICIKNIVLDSGFSSFEKVARQIISKKSGMPMLFSKPIFQTLLSAVEKQHKIKLVVELDKLVQINVPALFLYSQNDDMVSAKHTKFIFEEYGGMKQKIQLYVGHNEQRPHLIIKEVFSVLRKALRDPFQLRKRSVSCKKMGLSVTKNSKRVKTIQTYFDDEQDIPISLQNKFKQLIKTPNNKQNKLKKNQNKFNQIKQGQINQTNHNVLQLSPRPLKISKVDGNNEKKTKKQFFNQEIHHFQHQKENLNTLNIHNKEHHKKDQKLKLSHRDLIKDISTENINCFKNTNNLQQNISYLHLDSFQTKKLENQPTLQKLYTPYDFCQSNQKQPTSIFMTKTPIKSKQLKKDTLFIETQQFSTIDLNEYKPNLNQKTSLNRQNEKQRIKKVTQKNIFQQQLLNKKLSTVQKSEKSNQTDIKKSQYYLQKPQSGNIHHLKSKTFTCIIQQTIHKNNQKINPVFQEKKFVQNNIRNTIYKQLLKDDYKNKNNPILYNNYSSLNPKNNQNKVNFEFNHNLFVSNAHHIRYLSNQNYM